MKPFKQVTGQGIPLAMDDVDTDRIIPAQYLTRVDKRGYGAHLFQGLREQDPHFVFNNPSYENATILLTKSNFGCGSSREHAVWALQQAGIEVIIAKSFSDIFYNNALKNGLLVISLKSAIVDDLIHLGEEENIIYHVDLVKQTVSTYDGKQYSFSIDPFRKASLLSGKDDLDYLLEVTS